MITEMSGSISAR